MKLYSRWQNSAGERVRIALNLKGLAYDYIPVRTLPEGVYRQINPQGLMPALETEGRVICQSGAILDYLETRHPDPPLLPEDPLLRAEARAFALMITAEMHALTVNRVRKYLGSLAVDAAGVRQWTQHWLGEGFAALEVMMARRPETWPFTFGETPGWADLHLVPQMSAARRLGLDLAPYPLLLGIESRAMALDAFKRARPEDMPDFPGE